jgi:phosphate transport system substrate-binding protein
MPARRFLVLLAMLAPLATAACTRAAPRTGEKTTISVKGSDTMVVLGQRWAEEYARVAPSITVQVTGGGSGTGIAALIGGSADLCQASRPMTEREKREVRESRGHSIIETKVALDALAVYVNEENPVRELSIADVARIYRGDATRWSEVGGAEHAIVLYGRGNGSGTYAYFQEHVLLGQDFAAATQSLGGTSALVSAVKEDPFGIGYGGIAYTKGIRALAIRAGTGAAVEPRLETAQDGTYPLARFLYFYTVEGADPVVARFVAWATGPEGQRTISEVGYFPLPAASGKS